MNVLKYLALPGSVPATYTAVQDSIFADLSEGKNVVDESKYVARALAFSNLPRERFKYIYIVRDCRGVAHSFGKSAQQPRGILGSSCYYLLVNVAAHLAAWTRLRGRLIKVRYEDLVSFPERELTRIGQFIGIDMSVVIGKINSAEPVAIGHLVSGNRLRSTGSVKIKADDQWRRSLGWPRRVLAYPLCLPVQLLNGYRL